MARKKIKTTSDEDVLIVDDSERQLLDLRDWLSVNYPDVIEEYDDIARGLI